MCFRRSTRCGNSSEEHGRAASDAISAAPADSGMVRDSEVITDGGHANREATISRLVFTDGAMQWLLVQPESRVTQK